MSHYAKIENGTVTNVIVADSNFIASQSGPWIQTSYNTRGGIHYGPNGLPDSGVPLRKNYAGIGYIYDNVRDAFYIPKPSNLYELNDTTCLWEVKPEYTPLVTVSLVTAVPSLPVTTANNPATINGTIIRDKQLVLFDSIPAAGVYEYDQPTGVFSFIDKTASTVVTANNNSVIYKYVNNKWESTSI